MTAPTPERPPLDVEALKRRAEMAMQMGRPIPAEYGGMFLAVLTEREDGPLPDGTVREEDFERFRAEYERGTAREAEEVSRG